MRTSATLGVTGQQEVRPGIWEDVNVEVPVLGTVKQTTEVLEGGDNILPRHVTTTSISVPAREVGLRDNSDIRYIIFKGIPWQIRNIVDEPPKIVIFIGEKYNGPRPE